MSREETNKLKYTIAYQSSGYVYSFLANELIFCDYRKL